MTRTQFLDARRNIRRELVAYLSILLIGMLASLSYLVVVYSAATLRKDAVNFYDRCGFWDLEIASTALLDEEDLEAIRALPGVAEAEGVLQTDAGLRAGGENTDISVAGLPETISRPMLLEGRLPAAVTECAVQKRLAELCGLSVGQQITLDSVPIGQVYPLLHKTYVITGVFETPDAIADMIAVRPLVLVHADSFDREGLDRAFMKIRVRIDGAPKDRYSDAYWEAIEPVQSAIDAIAGERAALRSEKLRSGMDSQIREGQAQLAEAGEQLADACRKLDEGRRELAEKKEQLAGAREELDRGWQALREAEKELDEGKAALDRGGAVLTEAEYRLASIPGAITKAVAILDEIEKHTGRVTLPGALDSAVQQYRDGMNAYGEGRALWYSKGEEYLDALTLFEKNKKQLEDGEKQYGEAEDALIAGEEQLAQAEREIADGQARRRDGESALREAEQARSLLRDGSWIILNDRDNPGFLYAEANFNKLSTLSMSFSSIFLVVGALVIYATVGRMVEQQRKLIGATRAMGLYKREVFAKYLYFACTATMLGVLLGLLLAWLPMQRAVLRSYEKLLNYGQGTRSFLAPESGIVVGGALAISVAAVYLGCGRLLRLPAIQLIQGTAPASGRKKTRRSVRRNLFTRLILRNMRTDWSRVLVTTVSIAGGCMLMVIGFTLLYGISRMPSRQFGGILTYEAELFFDSAENAQAEAEIAAILDRSGLSYVRVLKKPAAFLERDRRSALTLVAAEKGSLEGYFALRSLDGKSALELPDSGALIPRRLSEYCGLDVGDSVTVYDAGMEPCAVRVAGIFENYYGQLFFLTPRSYEAIFRTAPEPNCFFVRTDGMRLDQLREKLAGVEGVTRVSDAAAERQVIEQYTASLNFVVWFMLFIAAIMDCFIVANFTMTYVQRKTRELTIMRVNGFSTGECVLYCALDPAVTTVLGTLLGLALGGVLGNVILRTTETPYIQMIREPSARTFLYSALLTFAFSALTNSYALSRIRDLKLSDITG